MYPRFPAVLLLAALCAAACDDNTALTPSTTPPATITELPFAGTLTVNGAKTKDFSTTGRGTITVTLTEVLPDSTTVIGLSLGTWNGASCHIIHDRQGAQGATFDVNASGVGNLCVRVYDPGTLTGPVTFSVDVSHP
jgi:hypothetical protein